MSLDLTRPLADITPRPAPPAASHRGAATSSRGRPRADASGPRCSPPSSSAWPSGASTPRSSLREDPLPVRPADRVVPGAQAPAGRPVGRDRPRPGRRPATRPTAPPPVTADLPIAAALAQAYCSPVAVKAAEECVQLHGGIGFTWEHPAHLFLKRAKADSLAFGTADQHRRRSGHPGRPTVVTDPRRGAAAGRSGAPAENSPSTDPPPRQRAGSRAKVDRRLLVRAAPPPAIRPPGGWTGEPRGRADARGDRRLAAVAHRRRGSAGQRRAHRRTGRGVAAHTVDQFKDLDGLYAAVDDRLVGRGRPTARPIAPTGRWPTG